ncbi:MAG TPA: homocysteine S-methyltransferase family protein [Candidatus Hydrogenedentes bacterium]|nr:homocysteine S-methyltransferase family protein [Candidatus Hydrogenedentota bacterium]
MTFFDVLKEQILVLDGATGTMIQTLDLHDADFGGSDYRMLSDLLTFSKPEAMKSIHRAFFDAGCHAIETNTFGASPLRLSEYDFSRLDLTHFAPIPYDVDLRAVSHEKFSYYLSRRGAEVACEAREEYRACPQYDGRPLFVLGSIGPSNRVVSHTKADLVEATFDTIMDNFHHQVAGLIDGGADVLLYETQQDILELKAAVMGGQRAMREKGRKLPIMAQVTVDSFGKMQIFNTDIHAALVTLEGIGIDVFGINCSIGPDQMEKTVAKIARFSHLPISIIPNAGLPVSENGKTVFRFDPRRFADLLRHFVETYGVNIVGGCCGTTPEHIRCVADAVKGLIPQPRTPERGLYVSGLQNAILLDSSSTLIRFGERLNVRGSKKVREAVENDQGINIDTLEEVAREQTEGVGCDIIDVCMDSNVTNTVETLKEVVRLLNTDFSGAMCLDSFQVDALAEAVKTYPGRPLINSISMEECAPGVLKLDAVIEAVEAHNPLYIALCTGPKGPGATVEEKLDLASQIIERAQNKYGIPPDRLFIDCNVFPIGAESVEGMNFAMETIEAVRQVKRKYPTVHTSLGVGNLTAGLAQKPHMRTVLTSVFLDEARKAGLDAAILNPNHYVFVSGLDPKDYALGRRVVFERDMDAFSELELIAQAKKGGDAKRRTSYEDLPLDRAICEKIKDGFKERESGSFAVNGHTYEYADLIVLQVAQAMELHAPLDFINVHLMGAMQELGDGFGRGEVSLPHLLRAADVMRHAMGFLEAYIRNESGVELQGGIQYRGTVVIGTVYQDVHSIGKDLARTLLENYGYRVIDLGVMTPLQKFIDTAKEHQADAIGMSALLVQTSNHMITVSKMMREQGLEIPVLVGGAPVSVRHAAYVALAGEGDRAKMRSDVFYCRTAMDGVNVMNTILSGANQQEFFADNKAKLIKRLEHAEQRASEEESLMASLPRRIVSFTGHSLPDQPRFRQRRYEYALEEFARHVDIKTLFSLNWRFGGTSAWKRAGHTQQELEALFEEWVRQATGNGWIRPQGVMGLYPCQSDGDKVLIFDPENPDREIARLEFTPVIGGSRQDIVSGAQYFRTKASGHLDVIGLQITSSGPQVDEVLQELKARGDSESYLLLQGLSDRIAEDMAEHLHQEQRNLIGVSSDTGQRWSPGYPGMRNIEMNKVLLDCLDATRLIGVRITEAGEFSPTGTTAAAVSFHPDARYL